MNRTAACQTASLILLAVTVILLSGLAFATLVTTDGLRAAYRDLDAALPAVTTLLLKAPAVAYLAPIALLIVALIAKELLIPRPAVRLCINLAAALLALALATTWLLALYLPMLRLVESLG